MADDGSKQTSAVWPLPKFQFRVRFGDADPLSFQEVIGLDVESEPIEYREGGPKQFSATKLSSLKKPRNVTLKKGVFPKDSAFWNWFNDIKMNTVKRETVTISLLDDNGAPTMIWTLSDAFPTKVTGSDLKSGSNEVAVESIELTYESLSVARG